MSHEPEPHTESEVAAAVEAAFKAGTAWRGMPAADRAAVLSAVADALVAGTEELWRTADAETSLGEARLRGEIVRTASQFRLFAEVILDGGYLDAVIDHADPSAVPPRPDLRRVNRALPGVVAVFAAGNFPFAFSTAGGDTASALAAGCPVVAKVHPGHPRTSELVAQTVRAVLPDPALLGLVHGFEAGGWLVKHPSVVAVGFTGSIAGGRAVQALIDERPEPIPFYGELGSANPVVVLPSALKGDVEALARGFAGSLTMGVGQFCTNPGLLFVPDDAGLLKAIGTAVAASSGGPMLTERIRDGYLDGIGRLRHLPVLAEGSGGEGELAVAPKVFTTGLAEFAEGLPGVGEECFGPSSIVITYRDPAELPAVLSRLAGSLTATVHAADPAEAEAVVAVLQRLAGRLIWNGWPTGVAVSWAVHHGGPRPSTTSPAHTSVGAAAIGRWVTPVAYQEWPAALLPLELVEDNPLGIPRRVDGKRP
ncbi:aldehyde dehydrogenase (NADP(+)) [Sinosporangium siamense]|uniref:Aldehyde dehydrogenase n=1 Tax=Sinosporangium siamense TaxID=1367973 RepID=A0A919R9G8_9ACTN|nr:aldehyde dehydrogenase (NADP(+)) [Sinosporangium siamense]GII89860.1 aldehyde dehydrogenase [Sinosporangium siamense]